MILLVLLTLAAYGRCVTFDFVNWDDLDLVVDNPVLNPPSGAHLAEIWTGPVKSLYTPLAYTVWSAAATVGRTQTPDAYGISLNPAVFHAINLLLHVGCVLLVFDLLLLLPLPSGEGTRRILAAALGAALFAVHPLQVEAVAWISGMNNVLAGFFSLACMAAYVRFAKHPAVSVKGLVVAIIALLLALASKPTAIVVPPMLLVIDWLIVGRRIEKALLGTIWFFIAAVPFVVVGRIVQQADDIVVPPFGQRLMVMADSIGFYFAKLAWPWPLIFDYGRVPQAVIDHGVAIASWIGLGIVSAGMVLCVVRRRWDWLGAVIVFIIGVLPVSGITPFAYQVYSTVADRYAYLSMAGAAVLAAILLNGMNKRLTAWAGGVIIFVLAGVCFVQNGYWQDSYTLTRHALAHNPSSFAAHDTLGYVLYRDQQYDEALLHFRQAVAIKSTDPIANTHLGGLLMQMHLAKEAVEPLKIAAEWKGSDPKIKLTLADAYLQSGRPAEAIPLLLNMRKSGSADAGLLYSIGLAYAQTEKLPEAAEALKASLQLQPRVKQTLYLLANIVAAMGQLDEAEGYLRKVLEIDPNFAPARRTLDQINAQRQAGGK